MSDDVLHEIAHLFVKEPGTCCNVSLAPQVGKCAKLVIELVPTEEQARNLCLILLETSE